MLPKAVTPSNKHTLCQWLFLWPPIDCVILSLWKNTSSGTINYKLLLHTSLAWCCLHPAVLNRPQQGRAEEQRKGTTKMNSASSSSINYLVQNGLYMCPTLKLIEEILIVVVRRRNLLTSMPRCQLMQKNIGLSLSRCSDASPPSHQDWLELFPFHALQSFVHWQNSQAFRCNSVSITDPFHLFNVVNVQIVL